MEGMGDETNRHATRFIMGERRKGKTKGTGRRLEDKKSELKIIRKWRKEKKKLSESRESKEK